MSSSRAPIVVLLVAAATPASADEPLDLRLDAEYRVDTTYIDPFELGGDDVTRTMWTDQRLRTNIHARHDDTVELHVQADFLAGVLFGDTGTYGIGPSTNSGVALASKQPNTTAWEVGLGEGGDPLDPDAYVPVLREADPVIVNHAYGDAFLPVGLLRAGRQPLSYGATAGALTVLDASVGHQWKWLGVDLAVDNVLGARWRDGEYHFASHWNPDETPSSLPTIHFVAGPPRMFRISGSVRF